MLETNTLTTTVPTQVALDKTVIDLEIIRGEQETEKISINYTESKGIPSGATIVWSSSDTDIVTVDQNGNIQTTGNKGGEVTITASYGDTKATCVVNVTVKEPTITLNTEAVNIEEGKTYQLEAITENIIGSVTWSSLDTSIASVDGNGLVTANKSGSTTITVTGGGISKTCTITVVKLVLTPTTVALEIPTGSTKTYQLTVEKSSNIGSLTWSSSDTTGVITVDSNGRITAKAPSSTTKTATITVTGGGITKTCKVTVTKVTPQVGDYVAYSGYSSTETIKWRYLKTENGKIYLTSSKQTNTEVTLNGRRAYVYNMPETLNDKCDDKYSKSGWSKAHNMDWNEAIYAQSKGIIKSTHNHWIATADPSTKPEYSGYYDGYMGAVIEGNLTWIHLESDSSGGWADTFALRPVIVLNSNVKFGAKNSAGEWTLVK